MGEAVAVVVDEVLLREPHEIVVDLGNVARRVVAVGAVVDTAR